MIFGHATQGTGGVYTFATTGTPTNSVQITGTVNPPLFINTFLPISKFTTSQVSIATRVCYDICLVLDRSASMAFDLSANEFSYPSEFRATPSWPIYLPPARRPAVGTS